MTTSRGQDRPRSNARVARWAWLGGDVPQKQRWASRQRVRCASGILEFIHRQPAGDDGLFSPTAGGAVERQTATFRAIPLRFSMPWGIAATSGSRPIHPLT